MALFWFSNQILIPVSPKFPLLGAALVVSNIAPIIYPALCLLMAATDLGPKLDSNFGGFVVKADMLRRPAAPWLKSAMSYFETLEP